ncbi:LIM domain-containing protein [Actinidia chinensis var. chinensis]|uniref:LIM domain-containing protein n=1 Tax=Actinidia chinensis var. chinensis TaxID=1590841 RepID=A0A2R6Q179_ACTCC|nr:LIM domain-containing protein [Actinidia chinensis var. chinensis]
MAQYRQSGFDRGVHHHGNGASDHVSIGIRAPPHKQHRSRRVKGRKPSIGAVIVILSLGFVVSVIAYLYLSRETEINDYHAQDDDLRSDSDFLTNVTRTQRLKILKFGHGSDAHGRDSRYWDKDDRRRDEDYSEDTLEHVYVGDQDGSTANVHISTKWKNGNKKSSRDESKGSETRGAGLYNEVGRDELKTYEAEYEASLKNVGDFREKHSSKNQLHNNEHVGLQNEEGDADDGYDDGIDLHDTQSEDYDDVRHDNEDSLDVASLNNMNRRESSDVVDTGTKDQNIAEVEEASTGSSGEKSSLNSQHSDKISTHSRHGSVLDGQSARRSSSERRPVSKKKPKRRKFSGSCEMKFSNSTARLVEPVESGKFSRFSLQYTEVEEKPDGQDPWEPRFAGHQSLVQREKSFFALDQKINCGFVKGTGFDLAEDDANYISSCHIAVISCIFGNSDRLRTPMGKTVSRYSRKNVCFVMFVDEVTFQTLSSEGQMLDRMGGVGLWKIVVVKNLPYTDMRRVGKIPKFLPHRLFPSARYSIWLDSKLRLQLDPLLLLEYFLWRRGYEYAISNHYDRHCVWEEVAQNKKLNKYNHTIIDQQFEFYQADGLKRFDASNPNKLLPSNVPEGSFIVRAHTPMSNLFSCLWFNEVDRFTPRDQLSFAYTYHKLRRMNRDKPFYLNMFKDCERRTIAKLYRHRSEEKANISRDEMG